MCSGQPQRSDDGFLGVKITRTKAERDYYFGVLLPFLMDRFHCSKDIANYLFKLTFNGGYSLETQTEREKFWECIEECREIFLHDFNILIPLPNEAKIEEENERNVEKGN
jgi:hypothetical protein